MSKEQFDPELIRQLADVLNDTGLTEIELDGESLRIRIAKEAAPVAATYTVPSAPQSPAAPQQQPQAVVEAAPAQATGHVVKSPMVGVVYASPKSGAAAFISVGDTVKEGDTLLIVEAMKVMNPIASPVSGVVKQIMVSDSVPVEFDEPLVIIE